MGDKKVAIIIPTYNRADFLPNAIEKALEQTYPCEIVVTDNASEDSTAQVMEKYKDKVKYIRLERNFGPHFSWLRGVMETDAEFIHLQFDDDWIKKDFIEKTIGLMNDEVGFVCSEADVFDETTKQFGASLRFDQTFPSGVQNSKHIEKYLIAGGMISPGACLFRRKEVLDALYQGNLPILESRNYHGVGPDHFMSLLAILRYPKIALIKEPLAVFRVHSGSITKDAEADREKHIKLGQAYEATKTYYKLLKFYNKNRWFQIYLNRNIILRRLSRELKLFVKKIGLRKKEVN